MFHIGLFLSACMKDSVQKLKTLNGVTWNGTYALPLIDAKFSPEDAFRFSDEVSSVGAYADGQVYIEYRNTEVSLKGQDLLKPPSVNARFKYALDASEQNLLEGGSVVMERDQIIEWPQNGASVDSILFKSGKLQVQAENAINHSLSLTVILLGGKPQSSVSKSIQLPWNGQIAQGSVDFDLNGVMADLSRGPKGNNQLRVRIRAIFTNTAGGRINSSDLLTCTFTANEFSWNRAHGIFSDRDILAKTNDVRLGALSADFIANKTKIKDARLKIKWKNTYGIPIQLNLNSLGFIYGNGSRTRINGNQNSYTAPAAVMDRGNPITGSDSVYLSSLNSNVASLVEAQPHYLFWNATLNTHSGSGSIKQTIWAESSCSFTISLELPLYLETEGITYSASADLQETWKNEATNLDWVIFRFDVRNELPLSLGLQAYFLDEQNNILDSLINPYKELFPSAVSDSLGNAKTATEERIDIKLERAKIQNVINARRVYVEMKAKTAQFQGKPIGICKVRQGQGLDVKFGIHTSLNIYRKF